MQTIRERKIRINYGALEREGELSGVETAMHSIACGIQEDSNGEIIEEIMDEKKLVCLNDAFRHWGEFDEYRIRK